MDLFGFWKHYSSLVGVLLQDIHKETRKAVSFVWGLGQEKAQQVQAAVQATLPLGAYDPADPMVLKVSMTDKDTVWSFGIPIGESQTIICRQLFSF